MLAIVIPYYKLTFFRETLQSLSEQTDKRFKVYIGDDASPENPSFLLAEYADTFDFEYKRFENNLGSESLVKQWERCIEMIGDEEWIMILGDDDYISSSLVKSWYANHEEFRDNTEVVRFTSVLVNEQGERIFQVYPNPKWESAEKSFLRKIRKQSRSSLSEYVFSKKTLQRNGFIDYPLAWHSDDKAWFDFSEDKPIYSVESDVFIRLSSINISGKKDNLDLKDKADFLFLKDLLQSKYLKKNSDVNATLLSFEQIIKKHRNLRIDEWQYLFKVYFRHFEIVSFGKFIRRFFVSFVK